MKALTVKGLIKVLLEVPMDTRIKLQIETDYIDDDGSRVTGQIFDIKAVQYKGGLCTLNFIDWRTDDDVLPSAKRRDNT